MSFPPRAPFRLANLPSKKCHDESRNQAAPHFGITDFCFFGCNNEITRRHDSRAARHGRAVNRGNCDQSRFGQRNQSLRDHFRSRMRFRLIGGLF